MFDKTTLVMGRAYPAHTTVNANVTERRAPTDESVRLLREMEAAAREAVIGSIHVNDTPLEFSLFHLSGGKSALDPLGLDTELAVRVVLKGVTMDVRHTFRQRGGESPEQAMERAVEELTKAVSDKLANTIVRASMSMAVRGKGGVGLSFK